jgi:tetratricopeptide (TPR) repeat protein
MKNFELIDLYFDNSLSPKEQLLFNDLLQNDLDFKNEFVFRKDLKKVIAVSQQEDLKASLGKFEDKIHHNSKLMMLPKKWLVAASVFVLASFGLYSVKTVYFPSNEVIYETYFTSCRNTIQPVVRGENPNTIEYRAFVAYEAHDYYKAINLFNSVADPEAPYINFYKGLSYMEINKLPRAIELLDPISKAENLEGKSADFDEKAKWYLALAYIKNNENKKAIEELSLISNQPSGTFKKEEALEVLAFLK